MFSGCQESIWTSLSASIYWDISPLFPLDHSQWPGDVNYYHNPDRGDIQDPRLGPGLYCQWMTRHLYTQLQSSDRGLRCYIRAESGPWNVFLWTNQCDLKPFEWVVSRYFILWCWKEIVYEPWNKTAHQAIYWVSQEQSKRLGNFLMWRPGADKKWLLIISRY